ncbi:hypothetical protein L208DRAFT_1392272, partial [Tricholoma matsutake]
MVRRCVGCCRKAFLPSSYNHCPDEAENWLPLPTRSWIVEELLLAVATPSTYY